MWDLMVYCKICSKTTINDNELCPSCSKKRSSAEMIIKLQDKLSFKGKLNNTILFNIGFKDKFRRNDLLWTLHDTNMIKQINKTKEEYEWTSLDKINKFVKKYDANNGKNFKITDKTIEQKQNKCEYCGKPVPPSKKKQKLCKNCKKTKKTLKNIKFIEIMDNTINTDELMEKTLKKDYQIEAIIFDLIDNDLIKKIDEKNYQKIPENIEKYQKEHENINNKINTAKSEKTKVKTKNTDQKVLNKEVPEPEVKENDLISKQSNTNKTSTIIAKKENPKTSIIQPAGWVLYHKIDHKTVNLKEYKILSEKTPGYTPSKVYLLKDYENVKWIKDLNRYYLYTKDQTEYKNIKLYTTDDIELSYKVKEEEDKTIKDTPKKEASISEEKITTTKQVNYIPHNEEIFDEFFNKYISVSEDETSWITYDELFKTFTKYVHDKYNMTIPELGFKGFNVLLYSKIKKISGIKTKNVNSTVEFNLIYNEYNFNKKDNEKVQEIKDIEDKQIEKPDKDKKENHIPINKLPEITTILRDYLNKHIKILHRKANEHDLTQKEIYKDFDKYLEEQNKFIDYSLFTYSFQQIIANIEEINKNVTDKKVHYNLQFKKAGQETKAQNKNLSKQGDVKETTSNVEKIKSNNEIFDEFYEKHLEKANDDLWIKKEKLFTLFNVFALNNYYVEINEYGIDGFNSILKSRKRKNNDIHERLRDGKIEYNLRYIPQKEPEMDKLKDNTTSPHKNNNDVNIEYSKLERYLDENFEIIDKVVDNKDITKEEIYKHYKIYYLEKFDNTISYNDFASLFTKLLFDKSGIKSMISEGKVHYNLKINDEYSDNKNKLNEKSRENITEKDYEILNKFWNENIQITQDISKGKTFEEIYEYFNESISNDDLNIKEEEFNVYFSQKTKDKENNIKHAIINRKLTYNLTYISEYNLDNENNKTDDFTIEHMLIIPDIIQNYLVNKNITKIKTEKELIVIYQDIIQDKEYLQLMKLISNTKEYIDVLNINKITQYEFQVNIEFIIKETEVKIKKENNKTKQTSQSEDTSKTADKLKEDTIDNSTKIKNTEKTKKTKYNLNDNENYNPDYISYNLFNTINEKILSIDNNVSRDVFKKIVGYKNKKRFVDIIIRKSSLTLSIYIPIEDLVDPRNICSDMRNKGSWASGFTEIKLTDEKDIGYVMNLIIQSHEYVHNKKEKNR